MTSASRRQLMRRIIWTFGILLIASASIGIIVIRRTVNDISQATAAHLSRLIAERIGEAARVSDIHIGLQIARLEHVRIPLDNYGSFVSIPAIEVRYDVLAVLSQPDRLERALHSVRLVNPTAKLDCRRHGAPHDSTANWLPDLLLPAEFVKFAQRYDSLLTLGVEDAQFEFVIGDGVSLQSRMPAILVTRKLPGAWQLSAEGELDYEGEYRVTASGLVDVRNDTASINVQVEVPAGALSAILIDSKPVFVSGGILQLDLQTSTRNSVIGGVAHFSDVAWSGNNFDLSSPRVDLDVVGDTLRLQPMTVRSPGFISIVEGWLALNGQGNVEGFSAIELQNIAEIQWLPRDIFSVSGGRLFLALAGTLAAPELDIYGNSESISLRGVKLQEVEVSAAYAANHLTIESFKAESGFGQISGRATLEFGHVPALQSKIRFDLKQSPNLMGWTSDLIAIEADVSGSLRSPVSLVSFLDTTSRQIIVGEVVRTVSGWNADVSDSEGRKCNISLTTGTPTPKLFLTHAETLLGALVEDWRSALEPVKRLDLCIAATASSASVEVTASMDESATLLSQFAREFELRGLFVRRDSSGLNFSGEWTGFSGRGDQFSGSAEIDVFDRVLTVHRFFVDNAGQIEGVVDLANQELDLSFDVRELDLQKLPLSPVFMEHIELEGAINGIVRIAGDLKRPDWTAAMSLTDAGILGISDYWGNLEVSATGGSLKLDRLEIGRGVNKIVEANGVIDLAQDCVSVKANAGSARAEDFVDALTGRPGFLSGEFFASAIVNGKVTAPAATATIRVGSGELIGTIHYDFLQSKVNVERDSSGRITVRIPDFTFGKQDYYSFACEGWIVPSEDGQLYAHMTGSGNFLDLVDQVDRTFVAEGSKGEFELLLGGSLRHPIIRSGNLRLWESRFSYPDATPIPLSADIDVHIEEPGIVKRGVVRMQSSPDVWLEVRTLPVCDSASFELQPLLIETPNICLGVLSVVTGTSGIPVRLPGLMKPEWNGSLSTVGSDRRITISGLGGDRMLVKGELAINNARLTFPLIQGKGVRLRPVARWLVRQLIEAQWDLGVYVGNANHYDVEVTGLKDSELFAPLRESSLFTTLADYVDHISVDALIDPSDQPIRIVGTIADSSFFLIGRLASSRGKVDYLDQTFRIDKVVSDFDATSVMPILEGRAETIGVDTLGRQTPVYLTMYQIDRETGIRQKRGRFDQVTFVLETDGATTPEGVLQLLGYNLTNASGKAGEFATTTMARVVGRQWLEPLERRIERWTPFDEVSLVAGGGRSSTMVRRQRDLVVQDTLAPNYAVRFITGSQVSVGKHLGDNLFITYTGELAHEQAGAQYRLGLVHLWNLEYRMRPVSKDLVLDLAVEYDEMERRRDESVSLKYSFPLEP